MSTSSRRSSRRLRTNTGDDPRAKWRAENNAAVARMLVRAMPAILAEVRTTYESYTSRKAQAIAQGYGRQVREPSVTAAYLREALPPHLWELGTNVKEQNRVVYAALGKLTRAGLLLSSIGIGDHGKEARCYEPV